MLMSGGSGNQHTNDLAALVGKRFVTASEAEMGAHLAESKIKAITGGDRICCRALYGNLFEYDPQFKLWIATNDLPYISGADDAIWRRIRLIEFPVTIPVEEQDRKLRDRLLKELTGILNWALEGHAQWCRQGLNPPESVTDAGREYRRETDFIEQFIDACCQRDPTASTMMKDLYATYLEWCENSGYEAISKEALGKELGRKGFEQMKGRAGNGRRGLRLLGDAIGLADVA